MNQDKKNAIIVSLNNDVSETIELADTLNYQVIETFIQHREKPDVKSYIGRGKIEEIKEFLDKNETPISLTIINGKLKPSQWFILEKKLDIQVYDRVRLILTIFEEHAERKEAKLQVRLAQLQYERPFVRELIHRTRSGEHPGLMAGGEYQVDDYYEMIKKQTKKIKQELKNISDNRKLRRRHRHTSGFYLVSLAGYTNAGKSSLLNLLSDENVKVEGKLFSTLSTTTRKINQKNIPILLTDTVGFIQDLPALIIDAFHSTLEEIKVADIILLITDISEKKEIIENKLKTSLDELTEIGAASPIIIIYNKTDLLTKKQLQHRIKYLQKKDLTENKKTVHISIKNKENIDELLNIIYDSLPQLTKIKIKLPINEETQSLISWIYEKANITNISYSNLVTLSVECNPGIKGKIITKCQTLNGKISF